MLVRYRSVRAAIASARHFSAEVAALSPVKSPNVSSTTTGGAAGGGRDTLGRRLLSLVHAKRSAVITIRKWKEDGRMVRKYELNRIVRELRKFKRYKHALEVCEWMTLQKDIKLVAGDYAVHLDLIAKVRGVNSAEKFFEDLPDKMRGELTCTALLHTFVQNKLSEKAGALIEKMSECSFLKSPLPYNHMMSLYISNGQLEKIPETIQELKKNMSPDIHTYNLWLTACASQNDIEAAERVYLELKKAKIDPDWVAFSTLTNLYIKKELPEKASSTVKEMEKRASRKNRAAYSSLITLLTNMKNKDEVDRVWKKMKSLFRKMNDAEYTCMISSLVKLGSIEEAEDLYTEWESVSGTGDSRVSNILLAAYINRNQIAMAESLNKRMEQKKIKPSYTTWELLTWGYLKEKHMDKVLECFEKAVLSVKKWNPDKKLVGEIFGKLEEQGNIKGAEQLLVTLRNAGFVSTEIYNSLLRTYATAGKMPLVVVERMRKDNVDLNDETHKLIEVTGKMRVSDVPMSFP